MKIGIAQLNFMIGDFLGNVDKMKIAIEQGIAANADLLLFSELSVCGYPPRDFLEFHHFIKQCEQTIQDLCILAGDKIAIVVGAPSKNPQKDGKELYNSAYFIEHGKIKHITHKTLLPTYDVFDEYRYFESNKTFDLISFKGKKIAITICEDIWDTGKENPMYRINPVAELAKLQPDILLNLSASPFHAHQAKDRVNVVRKNATTFQLPVFYCNTVGAQTELIFDGGSLVMNAKGELIDEMPYFEECVRFYDLESIEQTPISLNNEQDKNSIKLMHDALVCGIKDYFQKLGLKKAILGLSGGVDSALVLTLAVRALGNKNVLSVLMPSQFSSAHSIDDSIKLAENLDTPYKLTPAKQLFAIYEHTL